MDIIEKEGSEELSMRNIAAHLDCSVAGPYFYFQIQEEIVKALVSAGEERLAARLRAARALKTDVFEQITVLVRTYRNFAKKNQELHKLMFAMGGQRKVFTLVSPSYRVYFETLRDGVRSGAIKYSRSGYHSIARAMWSWGYGLVVLELTGATDQTRSRTDPIDEGMRLFERLLRDGEPGRSGAR